MMTRLPELLPNPKKWKTKPGRLRMSRIRSGWISGLTREMARVVERAIPGVALTFVSDPHTSAWFGDGTSGMPAHSTSRLPATVGQEGFRLSILSQGIYITAKNARGLFYGLQALRQILMTGLKEISCGVVTDGPALSLRGVHIDLKGYQPKFQKLNEFIELLATYRINTVLLELEDKFAFSSAPDVGRNGAYTPVQMRRLARTAHGLGVEIIPKLQCLAHVDYILKHPRYRALRENGHPFQFCPRNKAAFELWRQMAAEIMKCFPESRYFHIGADESWYLGECSRCRRFSKGSSYLHRVRQAAAFVRRRGKTPIIWEDIIRNLHGVLSAKELKEIWRLGKDVVLMYWVYGYSEKDNVFPFLSKYLREGFQVLGASGVSGCGGTSNDIPPLHTRAANVQAWTRTAIANHLEGVVATSWTRVGSADPPAESHPATVLPVLYAADSMWSGCGDSVEAFCGRAGRIFFGAEHHELIEFLQTADRYAGDSEQLKRLEATVAREREYMALLIAGAAVASYRLQFQRFMNTWRIYWDRLGGRLEDYRLNRVRDEFSAAEQGLQMARNRMRSALRQFYPKPDVDAVIRSRFGLDAELLAKAKHSLRRTRFA